MASPERHTRLRYLLLDDCLTEATVHTELRWFKTTLLHELNERLHAHSPGVKPIAMRTLEKDLVDLEIVYGTRVMRCRQNGRVYYRYASLSDSIQSGHWTKEERLIGRQFLDFMDRRVGMPQWDWWMKAHMRLRYAMGLAGAFKTETPDQWPFEELRLTHDERKWYAEIVESLFDQRPVRLACEMEAETGTQRMNFLPERIVHQQDGMMILGTGWDAEAQDWFRACLKLSDIKSLVDVAVEWPGGQKPPRSNWSDYTGQRLGIDAGLIRDYDSAPQTLRVWVESDLAQQFLHEPVHASQDLRIEHAGDGIILTLQLVPNEHWMRFAMQWGSKMQVLEPADLRDRLRDETRLASERYAPMFGP